MLDAAVKRLPRFLMEIAPIQRLIGAPSRLRLVGQSEMALHPGAARAVPELGTAQWSELAHAAVRSQAEAITLLRAWRDQGRSWPDIYLHGIGPTAQLMGTWWAADCMDFSSVSVGVARLQAAICELSPEFLAGARAVSGTPKRLLLVNPASQHTLGSLMAAEFFRLDGWWVQVVYAADAQDWLGMLNSDWFDLLGVGISADAQLPGLRGVLSQARSVSANPAVKIMLGGPLVQNRHELVNALQADFSAQSADEAVRLAGQWVVAG